MRNLKAWDPSAKRMNEIRGYVDNEETIKIFYKSGGFASYLKDRIVILEGTGLNDKNGKEIYEGDILHRHMNVYWEVMFKESKWVAKPKNNSSGLYLDASQFIECEVIGNIHENPDLI